MKSIWKFPLQDQPGRQIVEMPKGARILSLQMQRGVPTIWALVDLPTIEDELPCQAFFIYGTGWEMPDSPGDYVGTYQSVSGRYVWHVFAQERV